jgi:hypothetical protein
MWRSKDTRADVFVPPGAVSRETLLASAGLESLLSLHVRPRSAQDARAQVSWIRFAIRSEMSCIKL